MFYIVEQQRNVENRLPAHHGGHGVITNHHQLVHYVYIRINTPALLFKDWTKLNI